MGKKIPIFDCEGWCVFADLFALDRSELLAVAKNQVHMFIESHKSAHECPAGRGTKRGQRSRQKQFPDVVSIHGGRVSYLSCIVTLIL